MKDFRYVEPKSVEEAVAFLGKHPGEARILAGGTDLLVKMKRFLISPRYLVNLKAVGGLDRIEVDEQGCLRIGTLAKISDVYKSQVVRRSWGPIAYTAGKMASVQVRNVATVGGNLCNASPSADFAPIMISLQAELKLIGDRGARIVALEDFFVGPGRSVLETNEVLTEIIVPPPPERSASVYIKHGIRRAMDIAVVGSAVSLALDDDLRCNHARIVLGAVASTPLRALSAERVLEGKIIDQSLADLAGQTAADETRPITDVRGSEYYRRRISGVLVSRATLQALAKIGGYLEVSD